MERGAFEICFLCWWEDDGQDDADADSVRGGPNGEILLSEARANFRDHLTMYPIDKDTRIAGPDTVAEVHAKRSVIEAFDRLREGVEGPELEQLRAQITHACRILESEMKRKMQELEQSGGQGGDPGPA